MNMKISVLLDLVNRMSPNARRAKKDLRDVKTEANGLKNAGGTARLNGELKQTVGQALKAKAALANTKTEARALAQTGGAGKLQSDLKLTATQAQAAQAAMAKARAEARALANTNARPKGLDQLRKDLGGFQNRRAPGWVPPKANGGGVPEAGGLSAGQGAAAGAAAAGARNALMRAAPVIAPAATTAKGVTTFKELESAEKELAITTDETDKTVRKATEGFREQTGTLGTNAAEMVRTAQLFAASGQSFTTSTAAVVPTVKTAKASFAEVNDVATSGIAVMQNLTVPVEQLGEAYDRMAVSAKLGQVEMKNLARELPAILPSYEKVGYSGLKGLSDISAQMQIMRRSTSSAAEAANRLLNMNEKITSEETVKAFKENGINLQKEIEKGAKKEASAIDTFLKLTDKVVRKKDGTIDAFKLNEIAGDMQFRAATLSLLKAQEELAQMRDKISKTASGTVEKDFKRASDRVQGDFDRVSASFDKVMGRIGEAAKPAASKVASYFANALDAIDTRLQNLNDETRSGPLERGEARRKGEDAAKKEFEPSPVEASSSGDTSKSTDLADEFQRKVIDRFFGIGKVGDRDKDLKTSERNAYRAERDKRFAAMDDNAMRKLTDAILRRKGLEDKPQTAASRTERGQQARRVAVEKARDDELNANEDLRRARQLKAGRTKDEDDQTKRMSAELRSTISALTMGRPPPNAKEFTAKPGTGQKTSVDNAGFGSGAGPGKLGFGLGGPVAKDILQSLQVEMKPAGALITQQIAEGMKAGQGQTDGAAQQVGDSVKAKVSAVDLNGAGQQMMQGLASGITAGGAQAVAAAEAVAAKVRSTLAGAGNGVRSASARSVSSSALHDGVT